MASISSPPSTYNYSLQAIPAAFLFGLIPHGYGMARLMYETRNQASISMYACPPIFTVDSVPLTRATTTRPRTNLETWKSKLPTATWNHLVRARGAHLNSMEIFPLFAAAMIAGNVAHLPAKDMNSMALGFFEARAVYMTFYLTIKSDTLAFARTAAYAWSIAIPIVGLWRAGRVVAEREG